MCACIMAALTVVTPEQIQQQMNASVLQGTPATTCFLLTTTTATSPTNHPVSTAAPSKSSVRRSLSKIAPKRRSDSDPTSSSSDNAEVSVRCKRKIQFVHSNNGSSSAPTGVARRNERERNRVRQVNLGFATLRQHVPNGAKSKKMSKVETLRSAVQYIKQLQQLLSETGQNEDENNIPTFTERSFTHHGQSDKCQMNYNGSMMTHYSAASSPTPSLGSDASSTYDSLSPEDENLLDFATWLS